MGQVPDMISSGTVRCSFWPFRNRGWIPVPIYAARIVCTRRMVAQEMIH